MKDLFPFASLPAIFAIAVPREDWPFWEKQFDKWGIALVSLLFFVVLAIVGWKRERSRENRQNAKEEEKERKQAEREDKLEKERIRREEAAQSERVALLTENNNLQGRNIELQMELIKMNAAQTQVIKEQTKSNEALGRSMKDLMRISKTCPRLPQ